MVGTAPAAIDGAALASLVASMQAGATELLGALNGQPLLVVDLDASAGPAFRPAPSATSDDHAGPTLPAVVVGTSRSSQTTLPLGEVDVALTTVIDPPPPWVSVADLDQELLQLSARVSASPLAAVVLVQVLRSSPSPSFAHDLLVESLAYSTLQAGPELQAWQAGQTRHSPRRHRVEPEHRLLVEQVRDRLSLTLNRPHARNALNADLRDDLCHALATACADPGITEVHLYGSGPSFCSGGDLDEFGTARDPATAHLIRTSRSTARLLFAASDRVTAHLHGACVGAGIELAAAAGRVVGTPDTSVLLPEIGMGLIPGAGGTATLPRRIGRHRTAWLALSGRWIDAHTALGWGLLDDVRPD